MHYEGELQFLCETFRKSRVKVTVCAVNEFESVVKQKNDGLPGEAIDFNRLSEGLESYTVYKQTDSFGMCYLYLLLPEVAEPTIMCIGPYLTSSLTGERLLELGEKCGISPSKQRYFEEYLTSIPILGEGNHLFVMLTTFCERIWKRLSFAIVDVSKTEEAAPSPFGESMNNDRLDDVLVNMKTMENRYAFENELINAVTLGQLHKEELLLSAFSGNAFEKRLSDPLRNAKNYCVIMNTLLRKAAESGGVHPLYLDRMSSKFAGDIEHLSDLSVVAEFMREMFRSYCRLVRKHSIMNYSPVVQRAILLIDSDLSANLTLKTLADGLKVSPGYLSAIFKNDTDKTVTEYIRVKRMRHAAHLLKTTNLQIQTVALHCGIMDVHYFSKMFKKAVGKTPKDYRDSIKTTVGE